MISCAAMRPPPTLFSSVCEITARSDSDNMLRTISFSAAGNTSTTRSMVFAAELVCSVPNTKCPVSAAVSAKPDRLEVAHFADQDHVRDLRAAPSATPR